MNTYGVSILGTSPIVPSIIISVAAFVIGAFIGKPADQKDTGSVLFAE